LVAPGDTEHGLGITRDEMMSRVSVVYIALPVALLLALAGVIAFIWAVRSGQLDDLETPGLRILGDDDDTPSPHPHDPV
jgi:cbb3-type cytochrome oxidase maturation protein